MEQKWELKRMRQGVLRDAERYKEREAYLKQKQAEMGGENGSTAVS
eukprot:CAMPEP_0198730600 /NCGR_PEP_ID=MMETSP1475-20131203/25253_1 /TAXON_ID= ORGANISM="Unidentified sp., Strain CCMP1999" /NCGR_SAMPLE_ID=MMETSP1475 /ASSEMBLY_ACC=CAM_ASM_001111 /LENGTH=45 /DNA_ID= /DNA_START= /DNA_END= /DNA_ORIENTATION=